MEAVEPAESVDMLTLVVLEREGHLGPAVGLAVHEASTGHCRLRAMARVERLENAGLLADQALWAWITGGLIGLQAYLMSRPLTWVQE